VEMGQGVGVDARGISNWIASELFRLLKESGASITEIRVSPAALVGLLCLVNRGTITQATGKEVLAEMFQTGQSAEAIVAAKGLSQIADADELSSIVDRVIAANPKPVSEYRDGKDPAIRVLIGQVMRETRGKANPQVVEALLRAKIRGE